MVAVLEVSNIRNVILTIVRYFATTALRLLPSLPQKWFNLLKWVLTIGVISYIYKNNPDMYLGVILGISYILFCIDFYYSIKSLIDNYIQAPLFYYLNRIHDVMKKMRDISEMQDTLRGTIPSDQGRVLSERDLLILNLISKLESVKKDTKNIIKIINSLKISFKIIKIIITLGLTEAVIRLVNHLVDLYTQIKNAGG